VSESVSLQLWHWYSTDQALGASLFGRLCRDLESSPPPPSDDEKLRGLTVSEEISRQHRSFAIASLLASVALLESSINEFFASAEYPNLEGQASSPAMSVRMWSRLTSSSITYRHSSAFSSDSASSESLSSIPVVSPTRMVHS
jgi:hypothetical protein